MSLDGRIYDIERAMIDIKSNARSLQALIGGVQGFVEELSDKIEKKGSEGKYGDVAEFIEFAKVQGLAYFKMGDLEFRFAEKVSRETFPAKSPQVLDKSSPVEIQTEMPMADGMPSDEEMLFASVENIEIKKK